MLRYENWCVVLSHLKPPPSLSLSPFLPPSFMYFVVFCLKGAITSLHIITDSLTNPTKTENPHHSLIPSLY